jgi:hypothetical protein
MNYTPLDSSFQCASFETKKFDLAFFVEEKFTKNQKTPIFGSHTDKWGLWPETFPMPRFQRIVHNNSP